MTQHTLPERRRSQQTERFDPLSEFEQVTERMQRLLDRTFGGVWGSRIGAEVGAGAWTPTADIEEQDDSYVVEVEVPGVKPEDVSIELIGNELSITGETRQEERKGTVRRQMRRFGRFEYRLTLPDQVDSEKIDAELRDGVLVVRVPKTQRAQRRQIQVKSGSSTGRTRQGSSTS